MKSFKPTYLYVKTHNVTGLKYFGKTTAVDYQNYRGSGTYWKRHLKKHGYDVTTELIGYFTDRDECVKVALDFSQKHNIVDSDEWANFMLENGICGGDTMTGRSIEDQILTKEKLSKAHSNRTPEELALIKQKNSISTKKFIQDNPDVRQASAQKIVEKRKSNGQPWHSADTRIKIGLSSKSGTVEVREKISKSLTGRKNPEHSKRMSKKVGLDCPNTRLFIIIDAYSVETTITGCKELRQFCKMKNIAYEQLIRHINKGKIENINAQRPRPEMRNVIGYEIKEVKNDKLKKV